MSNENWSEYRRLIISSIDELKSELQSIRQAQEGYRIEMERIKMKVVFIGSAICLVVSAAFDILKNMFVN